MLHIMSHILPDKLFLQLGAGLIDDVPNYLHGSIETAELDRYMAKDNLPSVQKMLDLVDKAINKEETRHLSMVFSRQMARYTQNIWDHQARYSESQAQVPSWQLCVRTRLSLHQQAR